jgi:hypothetical protein
VFLFTKPDLNLLKTGGEEKESLVIADLSREQPVTVNVNWLNVERITKFAEVFVTLAMHTLLYCPGRTRM